jgi:hypothetical protein
MIFILFCISLCGVAYYQQKYLKLFEMVHKMILGQSEKKLKYSYKIENKKMILRPNLISGYTLEVRDFNGGNI